MNTNEISIIKKLICEERGFDEDIEIVCTPSIFNAAKKYKKECESDKDAGNNGRFFKTDQGEYIILVLNNIEPLLQKLILVHELTHAVDDYYFDKALEFNKISFEDARLLKDNFHYACDEATVKTIFEFHEIMKRIDFCNINLNDIYDLLNKIFETFVIKITEFH